MSRPKKQVPDPVFHRPSGQARVRFGHDDFYLGPWGSPEADEKYRRLAAEYLLTGKPPRKPSDKEVDSAISVNEVILSYWRFAESYYVKNGEGTSELHILRGALRPLKELFGHSLAAEFSPMKLKAVREWMVKDGGLCRTEVNRRVSRIRRVFKWATEHEMVEPSVFHGLQAVSPLKKGRCGVREADPVLPVDENTINATLKHLPRIVAGMAKLQLLTGMRPAEVCSLRPADIDQSGEVWEYRPQDHKMEHADRQRVVFLGPRSQQVLSEFLDRSASDYCFSPAESEAERKAERRANRKCRVQPSQVNRSKKRNPMRKPGDHYTTGSYRRAIQRACELAFGMPKHLQKIATTIPTEEREKLLAEARDWRKANCWSPNQLRHAKATLLRKTYGLETAQVCLGHAKANTTEIYAERDLAKAREVMAEVG